MSKLATLLNVVIVLGTALLASELFELWAYWLLKDEADLVNGFGVTFMALCASQAWRHRRA